MAPLTFPQALNLRRLSVKVDATGTVLSVSDTPASLFGCGARASASAGSVLICFLRFLYLASFGLAWPALLGINLPCWVSLGRRRYLHCQPRGRRAPPPEIGPRRFEPSSLLGRGLGSFVDVFAGLPEKGGPGGLDMERVLDAMARRRAPPRLFASLCGSFGGFLSWECPACTVCLESFWLTNSRLPAP